MIQVGAVRYLNSKPLYYRLGAIAPEAVLTMDVPSRLADRLARGELDVALIPSIEALRGMARGHRIIPGMAVAARGAVRSVKLFCRVAPDRIERLALDVGSRTSQALVQVWLDAVHGVRPRRLEPLPLGVSPLESTADAVLVIGDRAMVAPESAFATVIDLGAAWNELTGLPFVFAVWTARPGVALGGLPAALRQSRDEGLAHAAEIAREAAPRLGLSEAVCLDYLTNALSFDLGASEIAGLNHYARLAAGLGLVPEGVSLAFHHDDDHDDQPERSRPDLASRRC